MRRFRYGAFGIETGSWRSPHIGFSYTRGEEHNVLALALIGTLYFTYTPPRGGRDGESRTGVMLWWDMGTPYLDLDFMSDETGMVTYVTPEDTYARRWELFKKQGWSWLINLSDAVYGQMQIRRVPYTTQIVSIPLPEGNYAIELQIERLAFSWPRWPREVDGGFQGTWTGVGDVGIPVPHRGEPDAVYGASVHYPKTWTVYQKGRFIRHSILERFIRHSILEIQKNIIIGRLESGGLPCVLSPPAVGPSGWVEVDAATLKPLDDALAASDPAMDAELDAALAALDAALDAELAAEEEADGPLDPDVLAAIQRRDQDDADDGF